MKSYILRLATTLLLLLGTAEAATFDYVAEGGFVVGTERGEGDFYHAFGGDTVVLETNITRTKIFWSEYAHSPDGPDEGTSRTSWLELDDASGIILSNSIQQTFGSLIHINHVSTLEALEYVQVKWNLHLHNQAETNANNDFNRTWSFDLYNWETDNNDGSHAGGICPRDNVGVVVNPADNSQPYLAEGPGSDESECDDAHDYGATMDQNYTWVSGSTVYNISIAGFYDAGVLKGTFWTPEGETTTGVVRFAITEVGPETANIGDRVWLDTNNNGIQDPSETAGAPSVTVELWNGDNSSLVATTMTDGNGLYKFINVQTHRDSGSGPVPINYYLKFICPTDGQVSEFTTKYATGPTLSPTQYGNDSDVNASGVTDPFQLTVAELDENNETLNIDAGIKCGSIGDLVWIDKNQNGIQDIGEAGIAGVDINLYREENSTVFKPGISAVGGQYIFAPLKSGQYIVEFILPTGYKFSPQSAGTDDDVDSDANVTDGRTRVIDINLSNPSSQHFHNFDAGIFQELNITKEVNATSAINGDLVMYTITVTNNSERNATDVNVTDLIPDDVMYDDHHASQGTFVYTSGLWEIGLLEAGGSAELNITVEVDATSSGNVNNNACVVTEQNSIEICDDVNFTVDVTPGLAVDKTNPIDFNGGSIEVDDILGYTVTATNIGNITLTNVVVSDTLITPNTIICPTLAPLATCVLDGNYTVTQADMDAGDINNTGTADSDEIGPVDDNVSTPLTQTPVSIGDFAWYDDNDNGVQDPGEVPVNGLTVTLLDASDSPLATTTTDSAGYYIFDDLRPGTYRVVFSGLTSEYVFSTKQNDSVANPDGSTDPIILTTGNENLTIDVGLFCITTKDGGSAGGGCTYNPNSKSFDMMYVLMLLSILFFGRRELKRNER
jgi:uncharacterized repeat protein (TIGR01451 family)